MNEYQIARVLCIVTCLTFTCSCTPVRERAYKPSPRAVELVNTSIEHQKNGQQNEALDLINQAIEIDPKYPILYNHKAAILQSMNKNDEAIEALETLVQINPIAERYAGLGLSLDKAGRSVEAVENYRKALESYDHRLKLDSDNSNAKANRAFVLFMMDQGNESRQQIDDMLRTDPDDAEAKSIKIMLDTYPNNVTVHGQKITLLWQYIFRLWMREK